MARARYIIEREPVQWEYRIVDIETGRVMKRRSSRRRFCAACVFDDFWFTSPDEIRAGVHGGRIRMAEFERRVEARTPERRAEADAKLSRLNTIAYLNE